MAQRAAVAAAVLNARKPGKRRAVYHDSLDAYLERTSPAHHGARIAELDQYLRTRQEEAFFPNHTILKDQIKKEDRVEQLMVRVRARLDRADKYARFASVAIFFAIYVIALFLQRSPNIGKCARPYFKPWYVARSQVFKKKNSTCNWAQVFWGIFILFLGSTLV
jgi:hypothetical protein